MNLVAIAKERCANWNDSDGTCIGWSPEMLRQELVTINGKSIIKGLVKPLDHCRLKDGERCEYFERVVLPGLPRQEREKIGLPYVVNKDVKDAKNDPPVPLVKNFLGSKKSKKQKDLSKEAKTAPTRPRGSNDER